MSSDKEPVVVDEEEEEDDEPEDPRPAIEEKCAPHCKAFEQALESCNERVTKLREDGHEEANCTPQLFEYRGCMDHCVAPKLFEKLV